MRAVINVYNPLAETIPTIQYLMHMIMLSFTFSLEKSRMSHRRGPVLATGCGLHSLSLWRTLSMTHQPASYGSKVGTYRRTSMSRSAPKNIPWSYSHSHTHTKMKPMVVILHFFFSFKDGGISYDWPSTESEVHPRQGALGLCGTRQTRYGTSCYVLFPFLYLSIHLLDLACDPTRTADVAAIVMQEGTVQITKIDNLYV